MNKIKCHILEIDSHLGLHIYQGDDDTLVGIQQLDSRGSLIIDDETMGENENHNSHFIDEDHVKDWVSSTYIDTEIEYIDEVPGTATEDEEVSGES